MNEHEDNLPPEPEPEFEPENEMVESESETDFDPESSGMPTIEYLTVKMENGEELKAMSMFDLPFDRVTKALGYDGPEQIREMAALFKSALTWESAERMQIASMTEMSMGMGAWVAESHKDQMEKSIRRELKETLKTLESKTHEKRAPDLETENTVGSWIDRINNLEGERETGTPGPDSTPSKRPEGPDDILRMLGFDL